MQRLVKQRVFPMQNRLLERPLARDCCPEERQARAGTVSAAPSAAAYTESPFPTLSSAPPSSPPAVHRATSATASSTAHCAPGETAIASPAITRAPACRGSKPCPASPERDGIPRGSSARSPRTFFFRARGSWPRTAPRTSARSATTHPTSESARRVPSYAVSEHQRDSLRHAAAR